MTQKKHHQKKYPKKQWHNYNSKWQRKTSKCTRNQSCVEKM